MADSTSRQMQSKPPEPLSGLQLELLKLYSTDVTAEDLLQVKRLLGRYFGRKAIQAADRAWEERGLGDEDMEAWLHE